MKYIQNYNNFIAEKKAEISEYENGEYLGLIKKQSKRGNTITKSLTLYDFINNVSIAYIELDNLNDKNCFEIMRSYARKDWGAVIYDFALMDTHPLPVVPSKVIVPKAIKVWKHYYDLRSDVIKKQMTPEDVNYSKAYRNFLDDDFKSDNNLIYLNCYYFLEKSNLFNELIENGKILMELSNKKLSDISNSGYKEFKNVYEY